MPISAEDNYLRSRVSVLDSDNELHHRRKWAPDRFPARTPPHRISIWRNIIPYVSDLGWCLGPDLIGMGQSAASPSGTIALWTMRGISTRGSRRWTCART